MLAVVNADGICKPTRFNFADNRLGRLSSGHALDDIDERLVIRPEFAVWTSPPPVRSQAHLTLYAVGRPPAATFGSRTLRASRTFCLYESVVSGPGPATSTPSTYTASPAVDSLSGGPLTFGTTVMRNGFSLSVGPGCRCSRADNSRSCSSSWDSFFSFFSCGTGAALCTRSDTLDGAVLPVLLAARSAGRVLGGVSPLPAPNGAPARCGSLWALARRDTR